MNVHEIYLTLFIITRCIVRWNNAFFRRRQLILYKDNVSFKSKSPPRVFYIIQKYHLMIDTFMIIPTTDNTVIIISITLPCINTMYNMAFMRSRQTGLYLSNFGLSVGPFVPAQCRRPQRRHRPGFQVPAEAGTWCSQQRCKWPDLSTVFHDLPTTTISQDFQVFFRFCNAFNVS